MQPATPERSRDTYALRALRMGSASDQSSASSTLRSPDNEDHITPDTKGFRIGMTAFAMPFFDMSPSQDVLERLRPSDPDGVQVPAHVFARWLDALPMYADLASAHEVKVVHPMLQTFLHAQFPRLCMEPIHVKRGKGRVVERTLEELGLPGSMLHEESRPDVAGVAVDRNGATIPVVFGEFKSTRYSPQVGVAQLFASIQFAGSHLIASGFPGVIVTSHVIDLASKMGVRLATAYFDKLSALVQAVASGAHGALDPDWLRAPEAQYHSDDVYVPRGALRFESKRDFHASLRGAMFMYAQLHAMPFVCTPIGMASGMHTIQALEKHLSEIHRQGIVHGNVTSKAVSWKLDATRVAMQIVDWDRSFFAADGPSPKLKAEWMKEHPAKYQIAESGDKYERVDLLYGSQKKLVGD